MSAASLPLLESDSDARHCYVYALGCRDGYIYIGSAFDVAARFRIHRAGRGAFFTRLHPPMTILAFQEFATLLEARGQERRIKGLTRQKRLDWIENHRVPLVSEAESTPTPAP